MKLLIIFCTLFSFNVMAEMTHDNVVRSYEEGRLPDLAPWVEIALSGRCVFKNSDKRTASVLLTFNSENGLEIAPLSADKRSENFFDSLNFSTIVKRFPQTQQLKRFVHFTEEEAILFKQEGSHSYEARIREYIREEKWERNILQCRFPRALG